MGRWRTIIPFGLALFVAVLTYFILAKGQSNKKAGPPISQEPQTGSGVTVAVAARDLKWGEDIQFDDAKTVTWKHFLVEDNLPKGYVSYKESLEDRIVLIPIMVSEFITEQRLAPSGVSVGGVSMLVGPGKRAIAVKGDKVIGMAGLIHPGDRVDVLVTVKEPGRKQEITKTVLEDVVVLATGKEFRDQTKEEYSFDLYTLEVTAEEGEKLTLAANKGRLQFALRHASDSETVLTKGATVQDLLRSFRRPEARSERKGPLKHNYEVEVIPNDGNIQRRKFN